ncbi:MAG: hypothetical protein IIB68_04675 [Proteobacteria bacterium]|nr:hypothetical protein [Pseudomonadota bacterium]
MRLLTPLCAALLLVALPACVNRIVEYPPLPEQPQARDDAALVYFYRPDYHDHSSYHHHKRKNYEYVDDDGEFLGAVAEGSFFFAHVKPGTHNFSCLKIEIEAGQIYYLENYNGYRRNSWDPLILCPPKFVLRSADYAQPIVGGLTYTKVRKE